MRKKLRVLTWGVFLWAALLFPRCLLGQVVVNGTVTDESNRPLESAAITLEAQNPGAILETHSTKNGDFSFNVSLAGRYFLSVTSPGFYEVKRNPVELVVGANIISIELIAKENSRVSIDVYPEENLTVEHVAMSQNLNEEEIIDIPATRSNVLQNMIAVLPGVVKDQKGNLHFYGSSSEQTNWLLDGFSIADPSSGELETNLSVEAPQSFDLFSGRYSVEFGKGSGGTLIINSKMGNNKFERSATNFIPGVENSKGLRLSSWRPRLNLSGPIRKDKIWFYNGLDFNYRENIIAELPPGQDRTLNWAFSNLIRVQTNLSAGNILTSGFLFNYLNSPKTGLSPLDPVETTLDKRARHYFLNIKDQVALPSGAILEFGYGSYRAINREVPQGHDLYQITAFGHSGNFSTDTLRLGNRDQWLANAFLPPLNRFGSHQLKAGLDFIYSRYFQDISRTGFEYFRVDGTLSSRVLFGGNGEFSQSNFESAAYFQDRWAIRSWLLAEAGIRWDRDRILSDDSVTPRFSFALKPPGLKNTKFSAGFGQIPATTNLRLFTRDQDQYAVSTFYDKDGTIVGGPAITLFAIDKRQIKIPKTTNLSLGLEQGLPWAFYLRANYLRKRGHSGYTFATIDNPALIREPLQFPPFQLGRIYELQNSKLDIYDSFEVSLENHFLRKYEWFCSYARSRAYSNAALDINIDDPIILSDRSGRLPWDVPNRLLSWGFFPITKNNSVAYFLEWHDGFWFTVHDDEGRQVGKINSWEFPRFFTLNFHYERTVPFRRRLWALRLGVDNVTDRPNYTLVNSNLDSPDFLHFYGIQPRKFVLRIRALGKSPK